MPSPIIAHGLEGVIAGSTRLSRVNGLAGELIIVGYPLEEIAANASFEETTFLLWNDRLPNAAELADFQSTLSSLRALPEATVALLRAVAAEKTPPMDALRMATGTLSLGSVEGATNEAAALVARFPTVVAAYWRLLNGAEPVAPDASLGHAANYLYMLNGERPTAAQARGVETYLNTVIDHSFNASTFTARVITSTASGLGHHRRGGRVERSPARGRAGTCPGYGFRDRNG
jgi:citrate synthase